MTSALLSAGDCPPKLASLVSLVMKISAMPNVVSATAARTQFEQIIRRVTERNERFLVNRHGEPQAVIMSIKDYVDAIAPAAAWLKRSWVTAKRSGVAKMNMRDIDGEIRRNRQERKKDERAPDPS